MLLLSLRHALSLQVGDGLVLGPLAVPQAGGDHGHAGGGGGVEEEGQGIPEGFVKILIIVEENSKLLKLAQPDISGVQDVVPGGGPPVVGDPGESLPRVHDQGTFNESVLNFSIAQTNLQ